MAVQRRTVWFTDEDWAIIREDAKADGVSVSRFLAAALTRDGLRRIAAGEVVRTTTSSHELVFDETPTVHVAPLPAPRPFTPAPKPGKR